MKMTAQEYLTKTYSGKRLQEQYPLTTNGTWIIKGESENPDFTGSHYEPTLACVKGTLEKAVNYAVELPNFFTYGGGGRLEKVALIILS